MSSGYHLRELKIEVTAACPLQCLHCSSNAVPYAREQLDPGLVAQLIERFADDGGETMAISGGEPLLYTHLPDVLTLCRRLGVRPHLYTSGIVYRGSNLQQMSDGTLCLLGEANAKTIFSLHGARSATHDGVTGIPGSFVTTISAIGRAVRSGIDVEIHVVPTLLNVAEMGKVSLVARELGVRRVSWLRFVPQGRGSSNRDLLQLTAAEYRQIPALRRRLAKTVPEVEIRAGAPFNILLPEHPTPCAAALSELTIRPDGRAMPCDAFKQFRFPDRCCNVNEYSLQQVWQDSDLLRAVRRIRESEAASPCASCPAYTRCSGGCLAQKSIAAGALDNGRDPDCLLEFAEVGGGHAEALAIR